ncbi:MAG: hypothetical protein WBN18_06620, partial [Flavobacteriaceae bacterium]
AALFLVSCTKDTDDVVHVELEGKWTLTSASCFCAFDPNTDFSANKITFKGSTLVVNNTEYLTFLGSSGNYTYTVEGNLIGLPNGRQFRYSIKGSTLTLTFVDNPEVADDELSLSYLRN